MNAKRKGRPSVDPQDSFVGRIGQRIRTRRERRKLSVADAATAAGVSEPAWYHWEAGRHLQVDRLPAIAAALACKIRALIPDE
jgi:transcriptional regulator with XRE-family HTH domain